MQKSQCMKQVYQGKNVTEVKEETAFTLFYVRFSYLPSLKPGHPAEVKRTPAWRNNLEERHLG